MINTQGSTTIDNTSWDWDTAGGIPQIMDQIAAGTTTDMFYGQERWAALTQGGSISGIASDVRGSVIPTTGITGIAQSPTYTPWGAPTANTTAPRLGYRGELALDTLLHLRARQYKPGVGVFLSADPLDGLDGSTTLGQPYAYTDNNPLTRTDPTGEQARDHAFTADSEHVSDDETDPGRTSPRNPPDLDHIRSYLRAERRAPCNFRAKFRYSPKTINSSKAGGPVAVNAYNGSCSSPALANLVVDRKRADDAFQIPCQMHDYGYDILRLAHYAFGIASVFQARTSIDAELNERMGNVCGNTGLFGIWNKVSCQNARIAYYVAVRAWTSIERMPTRGGYSN